MFYHYFCIMAEPALERWEALAEAHFSYGEEFDENYIYCLCSRVLIRNGVKLYAVEKGGSESEPEKGDGDSHVHFSQDTTYKEKYEKEEVASCYCSASHTDNNYSTDEHDTNAPGLGPLQPSDSGADLTYHDAHSESHTVTTDSVVDQQNCPENYLGHPSFEDFWQINGERLIWASWISRYSDYIDPEYLDQSTQMPKEHSVDQINSLLESELADSKHIDMRERKFSYDSKVNPYKREKGHTQKSLSEQRGNDDDWMPVPRQRSCSEHERLLSPRTIDATDSMTNVTKMTMSSYDINSSHVTSESTHSDDYSVSSSSSADQSNDQTRVYIEDTPVETEEVDADQYWQLLWKKHFGEQYALHLESYIECHTDKTLPTSSGKQLPTINVEVVHGCEDASSEKPADFDCENSDGNSQELPSVVEVEKNVTNMKLHEGKPKNRTKGGRNYLSSVGVLLQNLQSEMDISEPVDGAHGHGTNDVAIADEVDGSTNTVAREMDTFSSNVSPFGPQDGDGDDEPPEKRPVTLKRSHEIDTEEAVAEKIKSTLTHMGLCFDSSLLPKGELVYRKKTYQLRLPRAKKTTAAKKTYFDDEGRPYSLDQEQNGENYINDMQTDVESLLSVQAPKDLEPLPTQSGDVTADPTTSTYKIESDTAGFSDTTEVFCDAETWKRKRRKHRKSLPPSVQLPADVATDPRLAKYWHRRHSLFQRFDHGVKLDAESWFSVTPEKVAKHLAERCRCDLIVDAFCGAGGNTIQFAQTCERVIAIDIDPTKIELARHNATVYGVADRIEFVVGDFFALAPTMHADVVFLSPPWGGPQYTKSRQYDLEGMLEPKPASELMAAALGISNNVAMFVPRTSRSEQLIELAKKTGSVEIEQNFLGRRFIAITAYYGDLVNY